MDFTQYISAELSALVPIMVGVGAWIKNNTEIKNKYIPILLTVLSIALCTLYTLSQGVSIEAMCTGIIQGILVAATAVYTNQLYKQAKTEE
jgi:hypothetical protein